MKPSLGLPLAQDSESTLSNITSIQSQLQSLYETCHEPLQIYHGSLTAAAFSDMKTTSNLQKALDKHTQLLQDMQQKPITTITVNPATYVLSPTKSGGLGLGIGAGCSGKTATILVSKSKTKTGLPLLLKNSINN